MPATFQLPPLSLSSWISQLGRVFKLQRITEIVQQFNVHVARGIDHLPRRPHGSKQLVAEEEEQVAQEESGKISSRFLLELDRAMDRSVLTNLQIVGSGSQERLQLGRCKRRESFGGKRRELVEPATITPKGERESRDAHYFERLSRPFDHPREIRLVLRVHRPPATLRREDDRQRPDTAVQVTLLHFGGFHVRDGGRGAT